MGSTTVISQDFESGLGSWTTVKNTTTTGTGFPADTAWTIRPNPYTSPNSTPVTFNSSGGSNFILSNADLGDSGTSVFTILQSPSFSSVGYTALSVSFRHDDRFLSATEAFVEVSTDGGTTWTPLKSYTATQGAPTAFVADSVNMDAYVGQAAVSIRFRYQDGWSWYWAIDDIVVTGTAPTQPCPTPPMVTSAVSTKTHGGAGSFAVNLPLTGSPGIECRLGGGTSDYTMAVTFNGPVTVTGSPQAELTAGTGCVGTGGSCDANGTVSISGNTVTIPLTNIGNAQVINVRLNGVNNAADVPLGAVMVPPMGVLLGDANGDAVVNSGDTALTKARSGQTTDGTNFRSDVNLDGIINAGDTAFVKAHSGTSLP